MGADEVRVDPLILTAAAGGCADLGDRVVQGNRHVGPETEAAVTGLPGWQSGRALETLLAAWTDEVTGLTAYLTAMEDAVNGCARDYQHTDHANAGLFDIGR